MNPDPPDPPEPLKPMLESPYANQEPVPESPATLPEPLRRRVARLEGRAAGSARSHQEGERLMRVAAAHFAQTQRPGLRLWRVAAPLAAAAAIALAVTGGWYFNLGSPVVTQEPLTAGVTDPTDLDLTPGDLNHDGSVNILDAFLLARHLDHKSRPPGGDLNGDGRIDAADVRQLVEMVVHIEPPDADGLPDASNASEVRS